MALHHAKPGELVDLTKWPRALDEQQSHTLIANDALQLSRLVLQKGETLPEHAISSTTIIQCVSGLLELGTTRATQSIGPGQLVYLEANDPHSLTGLEESIVLLTILGKSAS